MPLSLFAYLGSLACLGVLGSSAMAAKNSNAQLHLHTYILSSFWEIGGCLNLIKRLLYRGHFALLLKRDVKPRVGARWEKGKRNEEAHGVEQMHCEEGILAWNKQSACKAGEWWIGPRRVMEELWAWKEHGGKCFPPLVDAAFGCWLPPKSSEDGGVSEGARRREPAATTQVVGLMGQVGSGFHPDLRNDIIRKNDQKGAHLHFDALVSDWVIFLATRAKPQSYVACTPLHTTLKTLVIPLNPVTRPTLLLEVQAASTPSPVRFLEWVTCSTATSNQPLTMNSNVMGKTVAKSGEKAGGFLFRGGQSDGCLRSYAWSWTDLDDFIKLCAVYSDETGQEWKRILLLDFGCRVLLRQVLEAPRYQGSQSMSRYEGRGVHALAPNSDRGVQGACSYPAEQMHMNVDEEADASEAQSAFNIHIRL
ncbi:hypothetical protein QBC33DRAFT_513005 [Phialemonium atrogriseum]|uniref:Uncharacterized protein n=1 Tax=Phialemonium atrogriseum TaxID=1093897 RepID=A0AAJ0C689_9PEZI|nr:uncharacterized protein QBC33DRAFT_513005 [Phialemonium atrogriseum]KAK1769492.1 hypothetical protein QBC33DRAFT_513005 [Phialemonium atrogriseum]